MSSSDTQGTAGQLSFGRVLASLVVLWLAGSALRLTPLATPPVIPLLHDTFSLSQTEVGVLTGLVPVLFAVAAIPGSLLIARFGAYRTLLAGLVINAFGSALRGAAPNVELLYLATIVMAFGIAVMQPSLPPLVRDWLPHRIGFATAVYTNGLLVGETLPVALTIPLVLPLVGGSWRLSFLVWSLSVLAVVVLTVIFAPRLPREAAPNEAAAPRKWWPDWTDPLVWRLGIMLGAVNAMYFATNAFLPDYLNYRGRADLISAGLTSLNLSQLPGSFLLLAASHRFERHYWPYIVFGAIGLAGAIAIVTMADIWVIVGAGMVGFGAASTLVLMLALPPLLAAPDDVHRVSAAMFTISYTIAVLVPVLSGMAWDLTGIPASAFVPIGLVAVLLIALAPTIDFSGGALQRDRG